MIEGDFKIHTFNPYLNLGIVKGMPSNFIDLLEMHANIVKEKTDSRTQNSYIESWNYFVILVLH